MSGLAKADLFTSSITAVGHHEIDDPMTLPREKRMDSVQYESDLEQGLARAVQELKSIRGLVLFGFNIWTDAQAGESAFSADTRENSDLIVTLVRESSRRAAARL